MKLTGSGSPNYGKLREHNDEIREMFNQGLSSYKIAKQLGFDSSSVIKHCAKLGIIFPPKDRPENHLQEILQMREQKMSLRSIGKKLGFSHDSVSDMLIRHGEDTSKFIYNIDDTFFEKIDTEEKAYCLGLWMSDGNLYSTVLTLCMTDLDVIEKVKKAVNYGGIIYTIEPKKTNHKTKYAIHFNCKKMSQDITKYGITPNKSLTLQFPSKDLIPENLVKHLIRGIHDGDGSLHYYEKYKQWTISFVGTLEVMRGIEERSGAKGQYYFHGGDRNSNTWKWCIRKQSDIIKFLHWMYDDSTIYMDRKYKKYLACIEDLSTRT